MGPRQTGWGDMIGRCSPDSQHERPIVILRMLAVLFSGTRMTIKGTKPSRHPNVEYGRGKTTNLHYTPILGEKLHKEDKGKEW